MNWATSFCIPAPEGFHTAQKNCMRPLLSLFMQTGCCDKEGGLWEEAVEGLLDNGSAALSSKKSFQARHLQDGQFCLPECKAQWNCVYDIQRGLGMKHTFAGQQILLAGNGPPPHNHTLA